MFYVGVVGCNVVRDSVRQTDVDLLESRDTELDLSEADFAPAQCSLLLNSCTTPDSSTINWTLSGSTFPPCETHHVAQDAVFNGHTDASCNGVQNGEVEASSSAHYDAIGLPLCTDNSALSNCSEPVKADNYCVLSVDTDAARPILNVHQEDNIGTTVRCEMAANSADDNCLSTEHLPSELTTSHTDSACDVQTVDEQHTGHLTSDANISCEESEAMRAAADCGHEVSSTEASVVHDLPECRIEPTPQNIGNTDCEVDEPCYVSDVTEVSVNCPDVSLSAVRSVDVVLAETQPKAEEPTEPTVNDDDDNVAVQSLLVTSDNIGEVNLHVIDEVDSDMNEVDKTVGNSYCPTASMNKSTDVDVQQLNVLVVGSEGLWVETGGEGTYAVDHLERIITDNVARSTIELKKLDSCVDEHVPCAARSLESNVSETVDVNELILTSTEPVLQHTACSGTDVVNSDTGAQPIQSDTLSYYAASPLSVNITADSLSEATVSLPEEMSVDVIGSLCDMSAANSTKKANHPESLQKPGTGEMLMSCVSQSDVISQDNECASVCDDEQLSQHSVDELSNHLPVVEVNDTVAVDSGSVAVDEALMTKAFVDTGLSNDQPDRTVEQVYEYTSPYTASTHEPSLEDMAFSTPGNRDEKRDRCGVDVTGMSDRGLSEPAVLKDAISGQSLSVDSRQISECMSDSVERGESHVHEIQTLSTDGLHTLDQDEADVQGQSDRGQLRVTRSGEGEPSANLSESGVTIPSDEDAERWFEEKFAECEEDFDVDEFVSSAWTSYHPDVTDSERVVSSIHDEILAQNLFDAAAAGGDHIDGADVWLRVENASVAASAVDDSCPSSSDDPSQYVDGEEETADGYIPSSTTSTQSDGFTASPGCYSYSSLPDNVCILFHCFHFTPFVLAVIMECSVTVLQYFH